MFNVAGGFNAASVEVVNPTAVIQGGNRTVDEGSRVYFYSTGTDLGTGTLVSRQWSSNNPLIEINNPGAAQCDLDPTPAVGQSFQLTFTVTTTDGTDSTAVSVGVDDITSPEITILGDNPMILETGTAFVDPGAMMTDNVDPERIIYTTVTPDDSVEADTSLPYTYTDAAGNTTTEYRLVRYLEYAGSAPVAKIKQIGGVIELNKFTLDASDSTDVFEYQWEQVDGITIPLTSYDTATTTQMLEDIPKTERVTFKLTVTNPAGSDTEYVTFTAVSRMKPRKTIGVY